MLAAALETVVDFHVYVCTPDNCHPPTLLLGGSVFVERPLFCTSCVWLLTTRRYCGREATRASEELPLVNLQEFNSSLNAPSANARFDRARVCCWACRWEGASQSSQRRANAANFDARGEKRANAKCVPDVRRRRLGWAAGTQRGETVTQPGCNNEALWCEHRWLNVFIWQR